MEPYVIPGAALVMALAVYLIGTYLSRAKTSIPAGITRTESPDALNHELHSEFVDRVHVASSYVQMALAEHPALRHPELMVFVAGFLARLRRSWASGAGEVFLMAAFFDLLLMKISPPPRARSSSNKR